MAATSPTIATSKYSISENMLDDSPAVMRIEDLPPFVQFAQKYSPHKRPLLIVLFELVGILFFGLGVAQFTASLGLGLALYIIMTLFCLERSFSIPDSSKGLMLQQLLTNSEATNKGNKHASHHYRVFLIGELVFFVTFWIFGLLPLANSPVQLLGEHTFMITIVTGLVSSVCFWSFIPSFTNLMVVSAVSRFLWKHKIETYLCRIREILLQVVKNDIESNVKSASVFNEISDVQKEAETWARTFAIPLSTTPNTSGLLVFMVTIVSCLLIVGFGPGSTETRVTAIVIFSLLSLFLTFFLLKILRGIADINILWESLRVQYFNDAKIHHSLIVLNWKPDLFKDFMDQHAINSQVAFGVKITAERMRKIAGVVASVFAIVLYFLLRQEIRAITGATGV